jgi:hypothetical protein
MALFAALSVACSETTAPLSKEELAPRVSILAVGDTGRRHRPFAAWSEGQLAVARAMAMEDARSPVDAIVFLGDNFYENGLQRFEMVERIRENLALPYCRFIETTGPRADEIASHCRLEPGARNVVPLLAVVGNHDLMDGESMAIQCQEVADFVSNWKLPCDGIATLELDGGLSVIAYDSARPGWQKEGQRLRDAIRESKGPWRVLVAHHPVGVDRDDRPAPTPFVPSAIKAAGVPVHAHLGGHNHNLQLFVNEESLPPLRIVAGSGARARPEITQPHPDRVYGAARLGFARVDLTGEGSRERLRVSLYAAPPYPFLFWVEPELVARWSIDSQGKARDEGHPLASDNDAG